MPAPDLLPKIPSPLGETSAAALEWPRLREAIAARTFSPLGRAWVLALEPSSSLAWISQQQQRTAEMRALIAAGGSFDFHGLFDPTDLLDQTRIEGAALEGVQINRLLTVVERIAAWRNLIFNPEQNRVPHLRDSFIVAKVGSQGSEEADGIAALSSPLRAPDLNPLLRQLAGKIEPDGSLNDDASPDLRRIRRALERQHRTIEESLRRSLRSLTEGGSTQEDLITVRGERFVIPVKAEFKRKVPGVIHGSSSSGQTVFIEPLETIEQNNELVRLLDEEQAEIHRILVAMTRAIGNNADAIRTGAGILAEAESHMARTRFANELNCVRPVFVTSLLEDCHPERSAHRGEPALSEVEGKDLRLSNAPHLASETHPNLTSSRPEAHGFIVRRSGESPVFQNCHPERSGEAAESKDLRSSSAPHLASEAHLALTAARHPLLELRMRAAAREHGTDAAAPVPLNIVLPPDTKQLIISGPNTGGKTVSLKTLGLLALMAQAGVPVPATEARLPLFTAVYADIGDAQSIERNLSSFSAHVVNLDRISREASSSSLVLLDELGSATDPEEGAALAVAVASHFLAAGAWCCITTHLTSLKVYAASRAGVLNAAVGFDQQTMTPTYELRLGVPGASAGLNIASRLGLSPEIIAAARAQMSTQTADIGAFLDQLHDQLTAAAAERETLQLRERELAREKTRLDIEGRAEQKARVKELEGKLHLLLEDFAGQMRETVKSIGDKAVAQKLARDSAARLARLRREFSEQFSHTVVAHNTGADKSSAASDAPAQQAAAPRIIKPGDLVKLKSLGRQARVERILESNASGEARTFEVSIGPMKMRAAIDDVAGVESVSAATPLQAARKRGGITVATTEDPDYMPSEINVIGRTADEAHDEVERFLDRAFLAGLPRIRIVHGTGMGVLRRTLREYLRGHPHVTSISEPPQNEGGQGATVVDLRQ